MLPSITLKKPNRRQLFTYLFVVALLVFARPQPIFFSIGFILSLAGETLRVWACGYLHKNKVLTVWGPYAHVKHPLYLGTFLGFTGLIIAVWDTKPPGLWISSLGMALFLILFYGYYFPKKKRREGDRLFRRFGEAYLSWDKAVPHFIPKLTPYEAGTKASFSWKNVKRNSEFGMFSVFILGWFILFIKMETVFFL